MCDLTEKIAQATGRKKAQTVFKNGTVINVFSGELINADVAVCDDTIIGIGSYDGEEEIDINGKYIAPGFIDSHLHIESSMTTPANFVSRVLAHGTTTLIADPHEIANVSGRKGIEYMLSESERLPCNIMVMIPSCVPATPFEDSGAVMDADEVAFFKGKKNVAGLGEMMNFVGVNLGDKDVLKKLEVFSENADNIDGHAPGVSGKYLNAYRMAGITTDHECTTAEEVLERIRAGMMVLAREGSAAKNLDDIINAVKELGFGYDMIAFCTDDKHIEDIATEGHISYNIKRAIELGVPTVDAYRMATINAARHYRFKKLGAIAPGYQADMVILDDVQQVRINSVWYKGKKVSENCRPAAVEEGKVPEELLNSVKIGEITPDSFKLAVENSVSPVIKVLAGQIVTDRADVALPTEDGYFKANSEYQKIAVIERHKASGKIGVGVVSGMGISGAIASTVGHDSHNLLVIGDSDNDMFVAVKHLEKIGGGFVLVKDGKVLEDLPLPICGLITDEDPEKTEQKLKYMTGIARKMGVPEGIEPFITTSFLALPVIPRLRITNYGIFDVAEQQFLKI
ncbi:MAG: adenine deaminase [Oscillospiraceae bacterium]|nr:adenine deaminase [Oscillospiraceae bacterium]